MGLESWSRWRSERLLAEFHQVCTKTVDEQLIEELAGCSLAMPSVERIQPCRCGAAILRLLSRLVERIQPCGYRDGEESDWLTEAAVAFASRLF